MMSNFNSNLFEGLTEEGLKEAYRWLRQQTRRWFVDFVILLSFAILIVFSGVVMLFYWHGRTVPDSLIYSIFGALSVEFGAVAWRTKDNAPKY